MITYEISINNDTVEALQYRIYTKKLKTIDAQLCWSGHLNVRLSKGLWVSIMRIKTGTLNSGVIGFSFDLKKEYTYIETVSFLLQEHIGYLYIFSSLFKDHCIRL